MCSQSVSLSLAAPYLRQKGWSWPLSPPGQLSAVNPSLWAAQEQVCLFPGSFSNPRTPAAEKLPASALEAGLAGLLPPKATRESPCPLSPFLVDYGSLAFLGVETPFSPSILPVSCLCHGNLSRGALTSPATLFSSLCLQRLCFQMPQPRYSNQGAWYSPVHQGRPVDKSELPCVF